MVKAKVNPNDINHKDHPFWNVLLKALTIASAVVPAVTTGVVSKDTSDLIQKESGVASVILGQLANKQE
jgi:hypothetical protein